MGAPYGTGCANCCPWTTQGFCDGNGGGKCTSNTTVNVSDYGTIGLPYDSCSGFQIATFSVPSILGIPRAGPFNAPSSITVPVMVRAGCSGGHWGSLQFFWPGQLQSVGQNLYPTDSWHATDACGWPDINKEVHDGAYFGFYFLLNVHTLVTTSGSNCFSFSASYSYVPTYLHDITVGTTLGYGGSTNPQLFPTNPGALTFTSP